MERYKYQSSIKFVKTHNINKSNDLIPYLKVIVCFHLKIKTISKYIGEIYPNLKLIMNKSKNIEVKDIKIPKNTNLLDLP